MKEHPRSAVGQVSDLPAQAGRLRHRRGFFKGNMAVAAAAVLFVLQAACKTETDLPGKAYPQSIWMTGSLAKILQDRGAPGAAQSVRIYTTRNEIQSFQVHVHAGQVPINALSVDMSELVNTQTQSRVSAASTDIVVYREAYMNVTIPTARGVTFLNTTGPIPEILVPAIDPYYHQRTNAFPFTVAAGQNQSV